MYRNMTFFTRFDAQKLSASYARVRIIHREVRYVKKLHDSTGPSSTRDTWGLGQNSPNNSLCRCSKCLVFEHQTGRTGLDLELLNWALEQDPITVCSSGPEDINPFSCSTQLRLD